MISPRVATVEPDLLLVITMAYVLYAVLIVAGVNVTPAIVVEAIGKELSPVTVCNNVQVGANVTSAADVVGNVVVIFAPYIFHPVGICDAVPLAN